MELNTLTAIAPVDGRYRKQVESLAPYFSEYGLIQYRIRIEIEYFIALCEIPLPQLSSFDKKHYTTLRNVYSQFTLSDAQRVKELEKNTNHDVKAVEYFIREKLAHLQLGDFLEFIHFGLTSQDVNNTSIPLLLKEAFTTCITPEIDRTVSLLEELATTWKNQPMLAKTHGQPASPTRLGKEIYVFIERLKNQIQYYSTIPFSAKFGGATGNFNAHHVAYPSINWIEFGNTFVEHTLGLSRSQYTTQIEHYDNLGAFFDTTKRISTILIDLNRDMWQYISMNYFIQKVVANEVGSSAMPHKVNPIDFENSEGNLGITIALAEHFATKLPVSRLQRDLTDSTVLRNIGLPIAHLLIALKSLQKGLKKIELNPVVIHQDLESNWAVTAEAIQTILRRENYPDPYNALKMLTRGNQKITAEVIRTFIDTLQVSDSIKEELKQITPQNYTGILF
ncbi:MAG: adenylosuccinate lyase [Cytophagaceae bacterium]|jgi:adenylosuccinate lyase|nr:adenylosuccinate lyase [Cytophagaceae bacterium]